LAVGGTGAVVFLLFTHALLSLIVSVIFAAQLDGILSKIC